MIYVAFELESFMQVKSVTKDKCCLISTPAEALSEVTVTETGSRMMAIWRKARTGEPSFNRFVFTKGNEAWSWTVETGPQYERLYLITQLRTLKHGSDRTFYIPFTETEIGQEGVFQN